jgi:hypothetical protein
MKTRILIGKFVLLLEIFLFGLYIHLGINFYSIVIILAIMLHIFGGAWDEIGVCDG